MRNKNVAKLLLGLFIACSTLPIAAPDSSAQFGHISAPPKSVVIMGKSLSLKQRKGGGMGQNAIAMYISPMENNENWTLMFTVYYAPGQADPTTTAMGTVEAIKQRKASQKDPLASATLYEAKDGKSTNVDFTVSTTKPKLLEHNVFRYFRANGGLASYQIAMRVFGTGTNNGEVNGFIRDMPRMKTAMFMELARPDLPTWPN
jgi:hypothetical protein